MPETQSPPTIPMLCKRYELGEAAEALARPEHDGPAFIGALLEAEEFQAALSFLAHSLPRREAIWWAWTCARRTAGPEPPPETQAALDAIERWIVQPTEEHRRTAFEHAEQADVGTPAGSACLAVFFSGGSLAPPDIQAVPPPASAAPRAITGSIMFAAVSPPPEKAPERFRQFIGQGLEVANRIKLWNPA